MPTITKLRLEYLNIPIFDQHFDVFGSTFHHIQRQRGKKTCLTIYHIPRIMVPVRTWQHRQQLVEYHRSHGEIIFNAAVWSLFHEGCPKESPLIRRYDVQKRWSCRRHIQRSRDSLSVHAGLGESR